MAESVKCLFCKHEDLRSGARTHMKRGACWCVLFSPNNREVETGESLEPTSSKSSLVGKYQANKKPHLKKQDGEHLINDT